MNKIFCSKNSFGSLDFYVTDFNGVYFLCTKRFYTSLYEMYKNPVPVDKASDFKYTDKNTALNMFTEKLPIYLNYVAKYEGYSNNRTSKKASHRRSINPRNCSQKYCGEM